MKRKFNIIDVIITVFVCSVICFIIFKISHTSILNDSQNYAKPITYTIEVKNIMEMTVNAIPDSGDIYDKEGNYIGKVIKKEKTTAKKIMQKSDGEYVNAEIPDKFDVILTVEANAVVKNEGYFIDGKKNIGSGSEVHVKGPNIEFIANIVEIKTK